MRRGGLDDVERVLPALCSAYGIERLGSITGLDRIGYPTYCAYVPDTADTLSVYAGSAATAREARIVAAMEAVERQACARYEPDAIAAVRASDLAETFDLGAAGFVASTDAVVPCVAGVELRTGQPRFVPLELVRCPYRGERQFSTNCTTGVAAGSCYEDACDAALLEVVERFTFARTDAIARLFPRVLRVSAGLRDLGDDPTGTTIAFPTGHAPLDALAASIAAAGLSMQIIAIAQFGTPPLCVATVWDDDDLYVAGTSLAFDTATAAYKALSEAVQGRLVDRAATRDDLLLRDDPPSPHGEHVRKGAKRDIERWWHASPPLAPISAAAPSAAGIAELLDVLEDRYRAKPVCVRLTDGRSGAHVVRVVAAELSQNTIAQFDRLFPKFEQRVMV